MTANEKKYPISNKGNLMFYGADCVELSEKFGTPLYVLSEQRIRNMCRIYKSAVEDFGDAKILYASKALACKAVYKIVSSEGLGCDVVSEGELQTALSVNFPVGDICLHGNNKTYNELYLAVKNKIGYIVADSFEELGELDSICKELDLKQNILLRLNVGVEAHTHSYIQTAKTDSKFGFNIHGGYAKEFLKEALSKNNLNVIGFHSHIGSQIFEVKSFKQSIKILTEFMSDIKSEFSFVTKVLDIGGGIGIKYNEEDTELSDGDYFNFIKETCDCLKSELSEKNLDKPLLILEPGRSIVGDAGITLYTVGNIKYIPNIRNYLAVDGGMFENPRCALYDAKYSAVLANRPNDKAEILYHIAGKCCESGDIITKDCKLPKAKKGEILAVFPTGAYNYSMASNYNRNLIPEMVLIDKKGDANVIVKRQTVEQIMQNDLIPDYLNL